QHRRARPGDHGVRRRRDRRLRPAPAARPAPDRRAARGGPRRCAAGADRRCAQGPDRGARGDRHDHAQLHRALVPAMARPEAGRAYVLAMGLSGALAGLGGGVVVLGTASDLTGQVAGTIGFDGITVALLGRGKPWGVVASAVLFGALHAGGNRMQQVSHLAIDLVTVVQAVIVIFIAAPALVTAIFRLRATRGVSASLAKGW